MCFSPDSEEGSNLNSEKSTIKEQYANVVNQ